MSTIIVTVFCVSYLLIALEHGIRVNKAAIALIGGVLCWTVYILFTPQKEVVIESLTIHLGELSQILFFLLGAMTIVELIDAHNGFEIITSRIQTRKKSKLVWIIGFVTFFLSAVLDNLTTTIVMVSLVRKLIHDKKERLLFIGLIVIAANSGGAWSPIGDVTTTMLWIGKRITAGTIVKELILPSLVSVVVPMLLMQTMMKGEVKRTESSVQQAGENSHVLYRSLVFFCGIGALLFVPVFKTLTELPPFMGMMICLGVLWVIIEILYRGKEEASRFTITHVLRRIDTPSILFFLGILLAISALESVGELRSLALTLDKNLGDPDLIVISIGLISSVIDNVPLVAASMGMYPLSYYPTDHFFWEFMAYCAGTGGSALIIGSAAGIAAMGLERITFMWYLKKITWLALIGYFAGAVTFLLLQGLMN